MVEDYTKKTETFYVKTKRGKKKKVNFTSRMPISSSYHKNEVEK